MAISELEALLEAGLRAIGVAFSEREYADDMRLGSQVDDAFSDVTAPELRERARGLSPRDKFLQSIFEWPELSDYQSHVAWDSLPLFRRRSELVDGLQLEYEIDATDEEVSAGSQELANEVIARGRFSERVTFLDERGFDLGSVGYEHETGLATYDFLMESSPEAEALFRRRRVAAQALFDRLNGMGRCGQSASEVCAEIMEVLRPSR